MTEPAVAEPAVAEPAVGRHAGGAHAVPYYCPYCGEEDLRPHPAARAAWLCHGCTRVFSVLLVGLEVTR